MTTFMTTYEENTVKCAVCGSVAAQKKVASSFHWNSADLDLRPGADSRYTMSHWVQNCSKCGYVATDLERTADTRTLAFMRDQLWSELKFSSNLLRYSALQENLGDFEEAARGMLCGAWQYDDLQNKEFAIAHRKSAAGLFKRAIGAGQIEVEKVATIHLLLIDVLRRARLFEEARVQCGSFEESALKADNLQLMKDVVRFQEYLCEIRDDHCHSLDDAKNFASTGGVLDPPEADDRELKPPSLRAPAAAELTERETRRDRDEIRSVETRSEDNAANGLRNRWWIVAASVIGLAFSQGSINLYCFGLFLKPIGDDLGLNRGTLSLGVLCSSVICALATPVVGRLIDRFGNRAVMLPGIACYSASIAALASLRSSPQELVYVLFGLSGLFGAVQTPIVYAVLICKWFDRERGLALGLAVSGVGLGVMLVPQLASFAIDDYSWRTAYLILSVMILAGAFVPVALFVREPPESSRPPVGQSGDMHGLPGLTVTQALTRSWQFWSLSLAFFIGAVAIFGTITHVVPMLADRGFGLHAAAMALSSVGVAMIAGRIGSGYLLDRFNGPGVAIGAFLIPMAGIVLLASGQAEYTPFLGVVLCGVGVGAQIGLQPFFVSRYFGLKSIGAISGVMFALFLAGTGVGPFISGVSFDTWHSYLPALTGYATALVIAATLFVPLGSYPFSVISAQRLSHSTKQVQQI
jgi:MFS family permease